MMGFEKRTIAMDSVDIAVTVALEPRAIQLNEVSVRAERIREQGDTISYNVAGFSHKMDRTIGDVMQRMPGIDVAADGRVSYQGEDINRFYVEGSDLLGGKYGIATSGISHEDVAAVEVMENHQPLQVLSGISYSDKAAINLKLKNKAHATWSVHGDVGGGYGTQPEGVLWDGRVFAMAMMPGFQNLMTLRTNNTGIDLSSTTTDFFAPARGTDMGRYVSVGLPSVPDLERRRTLFNRSILASVNNLWKSRRGEFKAQVDYAMNRVTADAASITTYYLANGNRILTENRHGTDRRNTLSGRFAYEMNHRTAYISNTLRTDLGWDNVNLDVTGSHPNTQAASLPEYYVGNDFKLIHRFKERHLVTVGSAVEWESMPQTLAVATTRSEVVAQSVRDHAFYTCENAAYAFAVGGVTVGVEAGVRAYVRAMDSDLSGLPDAIPGTRKNVVNINYQTIYTTPKAEYRIRRINLTLDAPLSLSRYAFGGALEDRAEAYFSPALSINWKPNNRLSATLRGGAGRAPLNLRLIHPALVMTDYRSFTSGVDGFCNTTSQKLSATVAYKYPRRGIFANAMVAHTRSERPYTLVRSLYGDYVVYSYAGARSSGGMTMGSANINKTMDFVRGTAGLSGSFARNSMHLISDDGVVRSVATSWSATLKINGAPTPWLDVDGRLHYAASCLAMNGVGASWLSNMEGAVTLNFTPGTRWNLSATAQYYRNEVASGRYACVAMLDAKAVYRLNRRVGLSAALSNLLDRRTYAYTTYTQLQSVESLRYLRGRELLRSVILRK